VCSFTHAQTQTLYLDAKNRKKPFQEDVSIKKKNIIFITADMVSPDTYLQNRSISRQVNLKNLRSIAAEGIDFQKAYCTSPISGPSRAAICTGKYQPFLSNNERALRGMDSELRDDETIFQEFIRRVGYNTNHVGKGHVGFSVFSRAFGENMHMWDRWNPPVMEDNLYAAYLQKMGVEAPVYKKQLRGKTFDREKPGISLGGWIMQKNGKDFPIDAHYSVFLANLAIEKIDAMLAFKPDAPIYLQLEFFDPHQPFSIPAGFEKRYEELKKVIKLPESYVRVMEADFKPLPDESDIYQLYRRYWGAYDKEMVKDYIIANFLQTEVVDYAVGKLIEALKQRGLWDESVVIYSSDHGEMNARLGMFDKGVYFQPDVFRIPMYVKPPKSMAVKPHVSYEPVSTLDIAPTLLEFAGIVPPIDLDGQSLMPEITGQKTEHRQLLLQTGWHVGVNFGAGLFFDDGGKTWMYGYNIATGHQELYDVDADDSVNLFYTSQYAKQREIAISKTAEILRNDIRWRGYWPTFRLHNAEYLSNP